MYNNANGNYQDKEISSTPNEHLSPVNESVNIE